MAAAKSGPPPFCVEAMIEQRVFQYVREHGLLPVGGTAVVGVSGGPDSVCLLVLLHSRQAELGVSLHVAHLDHMLRGPDSEADAQFVADLAGRLGLPVTLGRRDVTRYRDERGLSLEEAAREVRYLFLADVAEAVGADRVAVGHTADDQAETVLLHLLRGSGLAGLQGMAPDSWLRLPDGRQLRLVRPLLATTRAETEACCQREGIVPRQDATNVSPYLLRSRVRRELLPLLETYNPAIRDGLRRMARLVGDDLDFVDEQSRGIWEHLARMEDGSVVFQSAPLAQLHPALQRHLLRRAVREVAGDLADLEAGHVEQMREALRGPSGRRIDLPRGLVFTIEYGLCRLSAGEPASPLPLLEGEHRLTVPGETILTGWIVRVTVRPVRGEDRWTPDPWQACLDFDRAGPSLVVRPRRAGDRFQPLGMAQVKSLQDFMVDAHVPRRWRDRVPIVANPDHIVWVVGWRPDERVKVAERTQKVICLDFRQAQEEGEDDDGQP